jgi:ABC-type polysaccharide/polyol phosphate export permease
MQKHRTVAALSDILAGVRAYPLAGMLGWQDVRQRYRRSSLGPLWLTISMGVMIGTIGIVFGTIFKTPLTDYLPFLALGIIFWGFISTVVTDGCAGFIAAEGIIKQLPIPLFVHIIRMIWRNILILAHNLVIFPIVLVVMARPLHWTMLVAVPGFLILVINLTWISLLFSIICARYRDLAQMVASVLQVVFYLTPIVWMPQTLPKGLAGSLLDLNPVYHLLDIVRTPLLGEYPSAISWSVSLILAVVGWGVALAMYSRFRSRIAYWL